MKFGQLIVILTSILVSVIVVSGARTHNEPEPLVETKLGKAKGSILKTVRGVEFKAFRGIRYAQAPVVDKRFKAPESVNSWGKNTLDATKDGFKCPQPFLAKETMSEDCLFLNVYTKSLTGKKPVIVHIHGGANYFGSSDSETEVGPEYLMDSNIVLVTINYRLGALGFLSMKTKEAPGNYGYLDQVMALQWVKDNIVSFGGNPDSVTISGQSSGGIAVTLHMASPLSKGLFHRAITMSGSGTNHFYVDSVAWTRRLATALACPMYNPKDVIDCLRQASWEKIIEVRGILELYGFSDIQWGPEVDGHFLLDTPTNVFARGDFNKVDIIAGITKDELNYLYESQSSNIGLLNDISINFDKYAPQLFIFNSKDENTIEKSDKIKKFYLKNKPIKDQAFSNFAVIFSDAIINHGVHRLVQLARKYVNVFYYRFDYLGRFSIFPDENNKPRGVSHADDLQYIFGNKWFGKRISQADPEMFMVDRMTKWWTSFAKDGFPCTENDIKWLPSNKTHVYTMFNDKSIHLGPEPYQERYQLWDEMFPVKK
ncbi:esterase FE4-like [Episyrphus balteatus]|uniref:esterase FE4-like n=1 Tax=Episyrphus balteatus TaxID=286459 RepID=UPI002485B3C8|nr:esterase FE4-like [Episyrphus balteatus]